MENEVAERVRRFYEQHPYPPPIGDLASYARAWQDPARRRADHHLHWPARPYRDDPAILIAGCGTSQAAKHALRWPSARVTAIDFSATSVRATLALKEKHGLANLDVHQLAIEAVGQLGRSFDQIVCTGVLHHLADPAAGLAALRAVLASGGAMHLMVYAPYGRTGVYLLQDFFRRISVQAGTDFGELLATLRALPPGHPLATLLREAPDFRDEAALADALLHPQDRAYTVDQLFDLIEGCDLTFGRWVRQAPYHPTCGALARLPHAERLARLPPRDQYAAVELFRGTMVRHSAIVHRRDDGGRAVLDFAGDAWLAHVPLRLPDTIAVRERLPPGAAAVLINRGHTYPDLVLPIDAQEQRLVDAIDGSRSVGDIARGAACPDRARALFERLYRCDQIVFDASA